jgi:ribA/ribD-fused uncharacterized protein
MIYSLEALRKEYQRGNIYKYLFFWGHTPPPDGSINQSCLSQWWMQPFKIEKIVYSCAEQYMMAEKARLFQDDEMLSKIMDARNPKTMKAYGRSVQNFNKPLWENNCRQIVKRANKAKFSQNQELLSYLLETRTRILVEASPRDRIWGIGMGKNNPDVENPMKWRGSNLLGFILTEVRDELTLEGAHV